MTLKRKTDIVRDLVLNMEIHSYPHPSSSWLLFGVVLLVGWFVLCWFFVGGGCLLVFF